MSALKRRLYRLLLPAYRVAMRQVRGLTLGARAIVLDGEGRVLLIEHSYTPGWHLPGGGVESGETTEEAVIRELEEEGGIRVEGRPVLLSIHSNGASFKGDHVLLFRVETFTAVPATSRGEILRAEWFHPHDLPEGTVGGVRRRIAEMLDGGPPDLFW
ncbi:MAG: NUDIX domain-containing protein [Caulobacter sp.]|nr:NUDIX domain-containing protein [Caulobacter sp.]